LNDRTPKPPSGLSLKARALSFLAVREHTHAELAQKLARHCEDPRAIELILADLSERGLLSNARFAESLVRSKGKRVSASQLGRLMRSKGVDESDITAATRDCDDLATARAIWQRKFAIAPEDARERARQVRFLQSRGFSLDVALKAIRGEPDQP
jgi:regulatory protein